MVNTICRFNHGEIVVVVVLVVVHNRVEYVTRSTPHNTAKNRMAARDKETLSTYRRTYKYRAICP